MRELLGVPRSGRAAPEAPVGAAPSFRARAACERPAEPCDAWGAFELERMGGALGGTVAALLLVKLACHGAGLAEDVALSAPECVGTTSAGVTPIEKYDDSDSDDVGWVRRSGRWNDVPYDVDPAGVHRLRQEPTAAEEHVHLRDADLLADHRCRTVAAKLETSMDRAAAADAGALPAMRSGARGAITWAASPTRGREGDFGRGWLMTGARGAFWRIEVINNEGMKVDDHDDRCRAVAQLESTQRGVPEHFQRRQFVRLVLLSGQCDDTNLQACEAIVRHRQMIEYSYAEMVEGAWSAPSAAPTRRPIGGRLCTVNSYDLPLVTMSPLDALLAIPYLIHFRRSLPIALPVVDFCLVGAVSGFNSVVLVTSMIGLVTSEALRRLRAPGFYGSEEDAKLGNYNPVLLSLLSAGSHSVTLADLRGAGGRRRVAEFVRDSALHAAALLSPLLWRNLKSSWGPTLYAVDASPTGLGVCPSAISAEEARGLRRCEPWRFSRGARLPPGLQAAAAAAVSDDPEVQRLSGAHDNGPRGLWDIDGGPPHAGSTADVLGSGLGDARENVFREVPPKLLKRDWMIAGRYRWKVEEPMPMLEGRAILHALRHALRSAQNFGRRIAVLGDAPAATCVASKGRSDSGAMLRVTQSVAALCLATGCALHCRWLPSEWNVADGPSRGLAARCRSRCLSRSPTTWSGVVRLGGPHPPRGMAPLLVAMLLRATPTTSSPSSGPGSRPVAMGSQTRAPPAGSPSSSTGFPSRAAPSAGPSEATRKAPRAPARAPPRGARQARAKEAARRRAAATAADGMTVCQTHSVRPATLRLHQDDFAFFKRWLKRQGHPMPEGEADTDLVLAQFLDEMYLDGVHLSLGQRAALFHQSSLSKAGARGCRRAAARRSRAGSVWRLRVPGGARDAADVEMYYRPNEPLTLRAMDLAPPVAGAWAGGSWSLTLRAREHGVASKTEAGPRAAGGPRGLGPALAALVEARFGAQWRLPVLKRPAGAASDPLLFAISSKQAGQAFERAAQALGLRRGDRRQGARLGEVLERLTPPLHAHALRCVDLLAAVAARCCGGGISFCDAHDLTLGKNQNCLMGWLSGGLIIGFHVALPCQTYSRIRDHGNGPPPLSYSAGISACEKGEQWLQALWLLGKAREIKLEPNIISYSAAISACEKSGKWQQALSLFGELREARLDPDVVSFGAAISACEKGGQWQRALVLLGVLRETQVDLDTRSLEPLGQALALLRELRGLRLEPSVVSCNAAISACEKCGQWQRALVLLGEAEETSAEPDVLSYNAAISACDKGGKWQFAWLLINALRGNTLKPDCISYSAAISACE
ncbi:unnamed protein product [Prorocentrum cordatum]|uniref:Pentatricopeptide repeat-containing protein, chloroplastic n=1 Tax=Prorocentrum cordatum TaxID=2364126 RepID=A0ABN9VA96_9DINO|nr:unnamed protein product [Polarella glacialis]